MVLSEVPNISLAVVLELPNHFAVSGSNLVHSELSAERAAARNNRHLPNATRRQNTDQRSCAPFRGRRHWPLSPGFLVTPTFGIPQMREFFSSVVASATLLLLLGFPTLAHGRIHENHLGPHHQRSTSHSTSGRHDSAPRHNTVSHSRLHQADDKVSVSRSCLNRETRQLLDRVEAEFGPVQIVSTCRPGAVIAGTNHPSMHRYGRAVDFNAPPGRKAAVVRWLAANNSGGTMTYASMGHIHMDTGPYRFVSLGAGAHGASRHHAHGNELTRIRLARHSAG
jgi:uncharacterized protein YcbK (DUF882 family)